MPQERRSTSPFNPLDKVHLAESIQQALLKTPVCPLPNPASRRGKDIESKFAGAGVYAIYYSGNYLPYAAIAAANAERQCRPIYVGKAVPKGGRRGGVALDAAAGTVLYDRLQKHAKSIRDGEEINLADFSCQYLVVDDIWIPLGESLMIRTFQTIWNLVVPGFGNNDPGGRRATQRRSYWDVVHPGRSWADKLAPNPKSKEAILENLAAFLAGKEAEIISEEDNEG
jgi:Eco29kI restriction endonuclease